MGPEEAAAEEAQQQQPRVQTIRIPLTNANTLNFIDLLLGLSPQGLGNIAGGVNDAEMRTHLNHFRTIAANGVFALSLVISVHDQRLSFGIEFGT